MDESEGSSSSKKKKKKKKGGGMCVMVYAVSTAHALTRFVPQQPKVCRRQKRIAEESRDSPTIMWHLDKRSHRQYLSKLFSSPAATLLVYGNLALHRRCLLVYSANHLTCNRRNHGAPRRFQPISYDVRRKEEYRKNGS